MDMLDSRHRVLWRGYREQWPEPIWLLRHHQLPRGRGRRAPTALPLVPGLGVWGDSPSRNREDLLSIPCLRLLGPRPPLCLLRDSI